MSSFSSTSFLSSSENVPDLTLSIVILFPTDFQPLTSMNESKSISVGFNFLFEKYLNEIVSPSL